MQRERLQVTRLLTEYDGPSQWKKRPARLTRLFEKKSERLPVR
jgi:hypothetical protein